MFRPLLIISALVFAPLGSLAGAQETRRAPVEVRDETTNPNPGIRYLLRHTTAPSRFHALTIDLSEEGVAIETTPYRERWASVTERGESEGYAAVINGGFWDSFGDALGVQAGGGRSWPNNEDDEHFGFFAIRRDGRAWISEPEQIDLPNRRRAAHAVSGRPQLVRRGRLARTDIDDTQHGNLRQPRSAVGVSRDGRTVYLVVVDGRQAASRGATLYELGRFMAELGAWRALNLDGGGSSALYLGQAGRVVSAPSGGRWEVMLGLGAEELEPEYGTKVRTTRGGEQETFVRGVEREVLNHIGVRAPAPLPPPSADTSSDTPSAPAVLGPSDSTSSQTAAVPRTLAPKAPPFRLGRLRERLPYIAAAAALGVVMLIALWRYRRRQATFEP